MNNKANYVQPATIRNLFLACRGKVNSENEEKSRKMRREDVFLVTEII